MTCAGSKGKDRQVVMKGAEISRALHLQKIILILAGKIYANLILEGYCDLISTTADFFAFPWSIANELSWKFMTY